MKVSRSWLQTYFADPLPPAAELARLITFHAFEVEGVEEVGDDAVIDIDVLANRSSDCLSHRGIARELSTILGVPMQRDPLREPLPAWPVPATLEVRIEDTARARRYLGAHVRGVSVGPSPEWLVDALETMGQKSINNVVDATNYVMFNLGQPLHAFDFDKLEKSEEGTRHITVRSAHEHEPFVSLSGETYELFPRHLVIADGVSGRALALAGVKGGKEAELSGDTTELVLEAAHFAYSDVRKTSRELRLATDASVRFQNDPSPHLAAYALRDVLALIKEVAGGELVGISEVFDPPAAHTPVRASVDETNALLGTSLTAEDIENLLVRLECDFSRHEEVFTVTPPWERTDLTSREDLIEELGRLYGYGNIPGRMLGEGPTVEVNTAFVLGERVRRFLHEAGYSEVLTYTLRAEGEVELQNPLASDKSFLRTDLTAGIVDALEKNARNAPLLGLDIVRLFELGPIFRAQGETVSLSLGVRAVRGKQSKADKELADSVAALAEMLGVELSTTIREGVWECSLEGALLAAEARVEPALPWNTAARFSPWSPYPFATRDIAVWVPEGVKAEEVLAVIVEATSELLVRHDLFDEFTKDGKTSFAYHLVFQAKDRTLTDDEVGKEMDTVTSGMRQRGWEVR